MTLLRVTRLSLWAATAAACLIAFACGGGTIESFSADHVTTAPNQPEQVARVFFAPQKMRMEMASPANPSEKMITIAREDLGVAWILMPSRSAYVEMPIDEAGMAQAMLELEDDQIVDDLGRETVSGFECRKLRITTSTAIMGRRMEQTAVMWKSDRLPMALRSESENGGVSELRDIQPGRQPEELFEVPDGYEMSEGGLFQLMAGARAGGGDGGDSARPSLRSLGEKARKALRGD